MVIRRLRTRFLLAGGLFVGAMVVCTVWGVSTFAGLSTAIDGSLRQWQEAVDRTAELADHLEREDDALLVALTADPDGARPRVEEQRRAFDADFEAIRGHLRGPEGEELAASLRRHVEDYRAAGNRFLGATDGPPTPERYHREVNPALRRAVADCKRLRGLTFEALKRAGTEVRDRARRDAGTLAGLSLAGVAFAALVLARLGRAVVGPVRRLAASVEEVRRGEFGRRLPVASADELGRLAEGFNPMAETLGDYRRSSLGELLLAKMTLEATLAALPEAVIVIDPDGRIVSLNPLAEEVLRAAGGGPAGRVEELPLSPEGLGMVRQALRGERTQANRAELGRALAVSLRGEGRTFALAVAPVPDFAPKRCGAVVVLDDVTDFARLDGLRTELIAVASHELKTPLTTLRMSLMMLAEEAANPTARQREMLDMAARGCQELAGTIDELLDLTRIEAGELRLARDRIDPGALAEHAAHALRAQFEDAGITLRVERECSSAVVSGDAARLGSVLANLLGNALKYTPPGGAVVVRVSCPPTAGRPVVRVAVTDTGPGVPEEFRDRVFEKFFRVEHHRPAQSEGVRGTGIGLYLCREIVAAHGGAIACRAGDAGRGTRVVFEIPLSEA